MKQRAKFRKFLSLLLSLAMALGVCGTALADEVTGLEDESVSVTIDGEDVELADANGESVAPVIIGGSAYLPIRAVAEALGLDVDWIGGSTREVQMTTQGGAQTAPANTEAIKTAVVRLNGSNGRFGFGDGYIMGYEDNGIYTFKNIPYGENERFMRATPVQGYGESADTPLRCTTNGPVSPPENTLTEYRNWAAAAAFYTPSDSDIFSIESQCLNLNIWTDSMSSSASKPVLVFMHGGGYQNGSAIELKMYDGSYIADYTDVVFVSVNARLNWLGYMDLTSIGGESNLGLSDMVLSLEWIKDNIAQFGGDPNNVTIMGQSGGGTKVSSLASSPKALEEDLFQKVVIASGFGSSALSAEAWAEETETLAAAVRASADFIDYIRANGDGLGVTGSTTLDQLAEVAANAPDEVVFQYLQQLEYSIFFALCSEADMSMTNTADGVYYDEAGSLTAGGLNETARHYTYLIGSNWAEFATGSSIDAIVNGFSSFGAPQEAVNNLTAAEKNERMEAWRHTTVRNDAGERVPATRTGSLEEIRAAFEAAYPGHDFYDLNSLSTLDLNNETYKTMAGLVEDGNSVYHYFTTYTMPTFGGSTMPHTSDIAFFFHSISTAPYLIHGGEAGAWNTADTMANSLANFCATGSPSASGLTAQPVSADLDHIILYDVDSRCVTPDFNAALVELATPVAD